MKKLVDLLLNQSLKDLFKYKSFFLLIFVLILADRMMKYFSKSNRFSLNLPEFETLGIQVADYVFNQLLIDIGQQIFNVRTFVIVVLLFLLKQLISMWPSSDMRRMHRKEREKFGLLASLVAIHGKQVVWDAIAVGSMVGITAVWMLASYFIGSAIWSLQKTILPLLVFAVLSCFIFPITMAGFSYSSKLAVISQGSFKEKLVLYFQLLTNFRVLVGSWLFYAARIAIEAIFVVILPLAVLWTMDNAILRIAIAGMIATPFYSFLKMASFKFFLFIYQPYPLVETEYQSYFQSS